MERKDGRKNSELRPVKITRGYNKYAEGSVLIEIGYTRVICNASLENKVPPFIEEQGRGKGWVTAEYSMLPRATHVRTRRNSSGRASEIQRLIGRSLRSVVDLALIGERTITLDCDVIQADGGTRTASITGAFVALADAVRYLILNYGVGERALRSYLAAVSIGILHGEEILDLNYEEDSSVDVDFNLAMTSLGEIVEIQGTAEGNPLTEAQLQRLINFGKEGNNKLIAIQKEILEPVIKDVNLFAL